ncbi:MAG: hypothetical protein ABMA14_19840, partial [Hyphomonadaceae bacterium]
QTTPTRITRETAPPCPPNDLHRELEHAPARFSRQTLRRPVMQFVYFILFIAAAVLAAGLIIGAAFKLIGFGIAALLVVVGVTWVMNKVRGPRTR